MQYDSVRQIGSGNFTNNVHENYSVTLGKMSDEVIQQHAFYQLIKMYDKKQFKI